MGQVHTVIPKTRAAIQETYKPTYGNIIENTQHENITFFTFPRPSVQLPESIDLRQTTCQPYPPIQEQNLLSNCASMSVVAAFQCMERKISQEQGELHKVESYIIPSVLYNYYYARHLNKNPDYDSGISIRNALKAGMLGISDEEHWPYNPTHVNTQPSITAQQNAQHHAITQWHTLQPDIYNIKTGLYLGYPILLSFIISEQMNAWFTTRDQQVLSQFILHVQPFPNKDIVASHAVLIIGYSDVLQALLARNSWGNSFGMDGHFWISYESISLPALQATFYLIQSICAKKTDRCVSEDDCQTLYVKQVCNYI